MCVPPSETTIARAPDPARCRGGRWRGRSQKPRRFRGPGRRGRAGPDLVDVVCRAQVFSRGRVAHLPFGDELWPLRTPTLPPAAETNTVIVGSRRLAVIEPATPYADELARLELALSRRVEAGADIVALCLTHHHPDHVGAAEALRERFEAPICAHPKTAARLAFTVDQAVDDEWVCELDGGRRLEAAFTPGHAPGHVVFIEPTAGLFYLGDLVAGQGTVLIDPDDGGDMAAYLASLARLKARLRPREGAAGPLTVIPSHGPPLTDPIAVIDRYVQHRRGREAKIVAALQQGAADASQLLTTSYGDVASDRRGLADKSLRAHLHKLVVDGRVRRDGERFAVVESDDPSQGRGSSAD
ncbi:MAG: MBL fold metallo-hydrolase [Myxococcales bacterium FL481]|nr:MAG: MBL fold metallo-hydrolase [Myxococcales bacterium FL481]